MSPPINFIMQCECAAAESVSACYYRVQIQWNLRSRDTLGLIALSLVERLPLSQ